jgi:hypothetical protein
LPSGCSARLASGVSSAEPVGKVTVIDAEGASRRATGAGAAGAGAAGAAAAGTGAGRVGSIGATMVPAGAAAAGAAAAGAAVDAELDLFMPRVSFEGLSFSISDIVAAST